MSLNPQCFNLPDIPILFSKGYTRFGRISRKINPEEILQTEMLKADPQLSSTNKLLAEMWGKVKTTSGPSTVARGPSAAVEGPIAAALFIKLIN